MKLLKWQQNILDSVKLMPTGELLLALLWAAAGDDYDGGMTDRGGWEVLALNGELMARMLVAELLTEAEIEKIKKGYL
jgi:hypothetical protein